MPTDQNGKPFNVAIIGAGMGGATTAFFLRRLFGAQVGITLFEQSGRIGGRIKAIPFGGLLCETGASHYISENVYMASFVDQFKLEVDNTKHAEGRVAFYDGSRTFTFSTLKNNSLMARIRLLCRYGLDLIALKLSTRRMIGEFSRIYELQERGHQYTTPAELLRALKPEFLEMTKWKYSDWLTKRERVSDRFREEMLYSLVSNNYCQDMDVHAFVGFITFAAAVGDGNSLKSGNEQIPERLIQSALDQNPEGSPKQFVHAQVTSISPSDDGKYQLEYRPPGTPETKKESFDYVVIAAPLHQGSSLRALGGLSLPSDNYCSMNTTLLTGVLKQSVFGVDDGALKKGICPFILPTWTGYLRQNCLFRSLSAIPLPSSKCHIWSVFSEPSRMPSPSETILSTYLDSVGTEKPQTVSWLAYPVYKALINPEEQLGSFVLARRLYYPNAIERIASCMEMAAIGGRNVALLIAADRKPEAPLVTRASKA